MNKPRLKAELMHDGRNRQPWWVSVSYRNGRIHSHTENYTRKAAALNALRALGDGVEIIEP